MSPSAKRSILVVDDDVEILRFLRETLASFAACDVDTTPSPQYAFELCLKKQYDLFLFDFTMPIVDGSVLYDFIRAAYLHGGMASARVLPPLIVMSGHAEEPRAQALLHEAGVRVFLAKPFSVARLLKSVEACLPGVTRGFGPPGSPV